MSPMNRLHRLAALLFALMLLLAPSEEAKGQASEDVQYFPETGHNVREEFLRFYKDTANAEFLYGYPLTEQFTSRDGRVVQYFQRARFELRADVTMNGQVQLTPLGQVTYELGNQKLEINNPAACRNFQTGFHVCFAFLDFYKANGGEEQFGNPISPFEFNDHLIVQYFEKARFEWRADRPEGQRVVMTDLGRIYFERLGEDPALLQPIRPLDATISSILSIHARAFVKSAIMPPSGQQTVYVVVQSQTNQPVSNATGKATVRFTNGSTVDYFFTTNSSGMGSFTFSFEGQRQGELVLVPIIVTYQGLSARTTTSFRIWY